MDIYREGDLEKQLDLMNPLGIYHFFRNPSVETAASAAYMPAMAYVGMRGAAFVVGESLPPWWGRIGHHWQLAKSQAKGTAAFAMCIAPYVAFVGGVYVAGQYTGRAIYRSTTIDTGGDYMRKHHGGHVSFRNPMTGM